jgi:hypothetical protein
MVYWSERSDLTEVAPRFLVPILITHTLLVFNCHDMTPSQAHKIYPLFCLPERVFPHCCSWMELRMLSKVVVVLMVDATVRQTMLRNNINN